VARPLREQFALTTLILLIPVGVVVTWAYGVTYSAQVGQVTSDATVIAGAVAKYIELSGPEGAARLKEYLDSIDLPEGSGIVVLNPKGTIAESVRASPDEYERADGSATVGGSDLTVSVAIPTHVAGQRASSIYQVIVAISGLATLMMLAVQAIFIRRWMPALAQLERTAERVGAGDLRPLQPTRMPSRELDHLRQAFGDMVEKLRTAREAIALQVEEERRMRQEVQLLQQQVIRQERLAAIGVLLSGIAHELNNPLQAISGFSEILQREPGIDSQARADLALIQKESARASAIIRNLSRFSRQQESKPAAVYLEDVVASVVELRQRRLHEQSIRLDREESATRAVKAVFTELQQVVLNFVINAEQSLIATPAAERHIIVRSRDTPTGIRLEVEDSGPGVPAEHETKLFQPFFTTKPVGEGTGLGLSVSYGIIRSFGGTIGYERGVLGGAVFYFDLPAMDSLA